MSASDHPHDRTASRVRHDRRRLVFGMLAALPCTRVAAEGRPTESALTAEQVVARHIAARGGVQAWRDVRAMSWSGKIDAGSGDSAARSTRYLQGSTMPNNKKERAELLAASRVAAPRQVQLPFTLEMARPHKNRLRIEFAGKSAVQVYDGKNGWKLRPFLNRNDVEPFSEGEARLEASRPDLDGPLLDHAARGTAVSLAGTEPVEGHDAYRLELLSRAGSRQQMWIDAKTFLDVKVEGNPRWMDGRMRTVWIYQRNFTSVEGLTIPMLLETVVEGYADSHKMLIEKVALNPRLDDSVFAKPRA